MSHLVVGHIILFIKLLQYFDFFKLHSVTLKLVDEELKLAGIANYQCLEIVWKSTLDTFILINSNKQVTHCTGKQGKWSTTIPVRENTGNLEILSKHRENIGNLVCSSCKFPDSKGRSKRYFDICSEKFQNSF